MARRLTLDEFFDRIEQAFPGHTPERYVDGDQGRLTWSKGDIKAGVEVANDEETKGAFVFMGDSSEPVQAVTEAVDLIRAIFADEVLLMDTFDRGTQISSALVAADDIGAGLPRPGLVRGRRADWITDIRLFAWSGGGSPLSRG